MNNILQLSQLPSGISGVIKAVTAHPGIRRRLQDMGLVPGTIIKCMYKSPFGDPTAYLIRGALVALRREDSDSILVTLETGGV